MSVAALPILGPLAAMALILVLRRATAALALSGAAVGTAGALVTLVRAWEGDRFATTLLGLPGLPLRLVVDPLAALLAATVAVVSLLVLIYAIGYMARERDHPRFYAEMSLFAAAMATLVLAGDWVLLLAAWEAIGFASYLLIGFWYERPDPPPAATRAFLTTRAADLGLYLAVFVLVAQAGTTAIGPTLRAGGGTATVAGLLLLLAAMGKAAQAPFQGWLQDAMVGPTPVSALLHSAALVAAGAILLTRAFPLFPDDALLIIGLVGGATALVTGTMALAQRDLKRLLAASTSSQLGFMFLAVGAGSPAAAMAHLVAHAAMKGALFLGAGIFQEAYDSTALADLAGAGRAHPRVFAAFAVAGLALAAVPPLAGFWSKGAVEAAAFASPHAWVLAPLALFGTLVTGAYVARALRLLWQGDAPPRLVPGLPWMGAGLAALAALAAALGLTVRPIGTLLGEPIPSDLPSMALGLLATVAGLLAGWRAPARRLLGPLYIPALAGFRLEGGFTGLVARPALALAAAADRADSIIHGAVLDLGSAAVRIAEAARALDEHGIDRLIGWLVRGVRAVGARARALQSGLVSRELVITAGSIAALLAVLVIVR